jgi:hypothetical protein
MGRHAVRIVARERALSKRAAAAPANCSWPPACGHGARAGLTIRQACRHRLAPHGNASARADSFP